MKEGNYFWVFGFVIFLDFVGITNFFGGFFGFSLETREDRRKETRQRQRWGYKEGKERKGQLETQIRQ